MKPKTREEKFLLTKDMAKVWGRKKKGVREEREREKRERERERERKWERKWERKLFLF